MIELGRSSVAGGMVSTAVRISGMTMQSFIKIGPFFRGLKCAVKARVLRNGG